MHSDTELGSRVAAAVASNSRNWNAGLVKVLPPALRELGVEKPVQFDTLRLEIRRGNASTEGIPMPTDLMSGEVEGGELLRCFVRASSIALLKLFDQRRLFIAPMRKQHGWVPPRPDHPSEAHPFSP